MLLRLLSIIIGYYNYILAPNTYIPDLCNTYSKLRACIGIIPQTAWLEQKLHGKRKLKGLKRYAFVLKVFNESLCFLLARKAFDYEGFILYMW